MALVQHYATLEQQARRLTRNQADAADLVQDTVERALRPTSHFVAGTNLGAWLARIMKNAFLDRCQREKNVSLDPAELDRLATQEPRIPELADLIPDSALELAVAELKPPQQVIFGLAYRDHLTHRQIAQRLRIPLATASVRLWRARKKIRQALESRWGWLVRGQGGGRVAVPANDIFVDLGPAGRQSRIPERSMAAMVVPPRNRARALR